MTIDINRTPVSKTRPLSSYQLIHDKVMPAWTSDIHAAVRTNTVLIRDYYYIAIYT